MEMIQYLLALVLIAAFCSKGLKGCSYRWKSAIASQQPFQHITGFAAEQFGGHLQVLGLRDSFDGATGGDGAEENLCHAIVLIK